MCELCDGRLADWLTALLACCGVRCRAGKAASLVFQGAWLVETAKIMMEGEPVATGMSGQSTGSSLVPMNVCV